MKTETIKVERRAKKTKTKSESSKPKTLLVMRTLLDRNDGDLSKKLDELDKNLNGNLPQDDNPIINKEIESSCYGPSNDNGMFYDDFLKKLKTENE